MKATVVGETRGRSPHRGDPGRVARHHGLAPRGDGSGPRGRGGVRGRLTESGGLYRADAAPGLDGNERKD